MKKLILVALMFLGTSGLALAATQVTQFITPSVSTVKGGVISNSGISCNGQANQSLVAVGGYNIKGILVGASGTAQCVAVTDLANCQTATGATSTSSVFESCAAANTSTYFDFSNSPIKVVNGIVVTTTRQDGFAAVYTQ